MPSIIVKNPAKIIRDKFESRLIEGEKEGIVADPRFFHYSSDSENFFPRERALKLVPELKRSIRRNRGEEKR